jgi:hypothetical protein
MTLKMALMGTPVCTEWSSAVGRHLAGWLSHDFGFATGGFAFSEVASEVLQTAK